jgi:hypothetical protein
MISRPILEFSQLYNRFEYGDRLNLRVSDVVRLKTGGLIRIGFLGALDSV